MKAHRQKFCELLKAQTVRLLVPEWQLYARPQLTAVLVRKVPPVTSTSVSVVASCSGGRYRIRGELVARPPPARLRSSDK